MTYQTDQPIEHQGSGYEEADKVLAAATAHGPLAADSYMPRDEDVED